MVKLQIQVKARGAGPVIMELCTGEKLVSHTFASSGLTLLTNSVFTIILCVLLFIPSAAFILPDFKLLFYLTPCIYCDVGVFYM